jgi:hypothetical protein
MKIHNNTTTTQQNNSHTQNNHPNALVLQNFTVTHFTLLKPNSTQLTPKTASVVPPEDGRLPPETCRGLRHNKVIVKVKVY